MLIYILLMTWVGFVIGFLFAGIMIRRALRICVLALLHILHAPHLDTAKHIARDALVDAGAEYKIFQYRKDYPAPPHIVDVGKSKK